MGRKTIDMEGTNTVIYIANPKRGSQYHATLQNTTGQTLTVVVSNDGGANFANPAAGALSIANNTFGEITEPYERIGLVIGAPGGSGAVIDIVEAG